MKSKLSYCQESGLFTWLDPPGQKLKPGDLAGSVNGDGYVFIQLGGKNYRAHRLAWFFVYGEWPIGQIDHIDRDRSNNRISNLRLVTNQDNNKNKAKYLNNSSGCTGVTWRKDRCKWQARIGIDFKQKSLGFYNDFDDAVAARKKAEEGLGFSKTHGE